jgi:hypothetical protein
VEEPLLLGGYKLDLRIYVLITSLCPLEAHCHEQGYARFCLHRYDRSTLDKYAHLTNLAVQGCDYHEEGRPNQNYVRLEALWADLASRGVDVLLVQARIKDALRLVLQSTSAAVALKKETRLKKKRDKEPAAGCQEKGKGKEKGNRDVRSERSKHDAKGGGRWSWRFDSDAEDFDGCKHFQMVGFDVALDHALTPVVLEANITPAVFDIGLQRQIVFDMLTKVLQPIPAVVCKCKQNTGKEVGIGTEEPTSAGEVEHVLGRDDGLLVMSALAGDWARGGDQLLHPEEWCAQHWRWRRAQTGGAGAGGPGSTATPYPPQRVLSPTDEEAIIAPALDAGGGTGSTSRGFAPLF